MLFAREYLSGQATTIWVLREQDGAMEVLDYIEGLKYSDRIQVNSLLKTVVTVGPPQNKRKYRCLRNHIWELKTRAGVRLLCCQATRGHILLVGSWKAKRNILDRHIERAEAIREAFLSGGECYEE